ncbi:SCO4225 family membrane protein [Streptomyces sp. GC420]|uniref:SCO4225 family membrane protein n=1 Tax=Streptomyces sp. GC420 TaxID=2697568 RepID=UPI001414F181|nr:hypothetical protein [Streptomyces sp. GC420]NBM14751.1 hypothetical protein [Streptomyces sp. GC420]
MTVNTRRLHGLARLTFGNPASMVYLGLVAAATLFLVFDTLFVDHADASFAGVYLLALASPTLFLFFGAEQLLWGGAEAPHWLLYVAVAVSVLVQSLLIGSVLRYLRGPAGAVRHHPQGA